MREGAQPGGWLQRESADRRRGQQAQAAMTLLMEIPTFPFAFLAIACGCLAAIGLRRRLPFFGGLFAPQVYQPLDRTDRRLAWAALAFGLSV